MKIRIKKVGSIYVAKKIYLWERILDSLVKYLRKY